TYRDVDLNLTAALNKDDAPNVLAIEVFPPEKGDLAITFVDWAPEVPDENMGLWQDVELKFSKPVAIRYPHVITDFDPANPTTAKVTVMADLVNPTDQAVTGTLEGQFEQLSIKQSVTLAAHETKTIK